MSASTQAAESIADSMAREAGVAAMRSLRIPSIGIQRYATNEGALTAQAVWTMGALCVNWILEEEPITPARARELIAQRIDSLGGTPHPDGFVTRGGNAPDDCESVTGEPWEALTQQRHEDSRIANHIDGFDRDDLGESPDY